MAKVKTIKVSEIRVISIFLLICAIIAGVVIFNGHKRNKENISLIESLQDSLTIKRGENGEYIAKISVLETENINSFFKLSFKDNELIKLQEEVKKYKKQLKDQGSVTTIETITKIDSIWKYHSLGSDTIVFSQSILTDSMVNPWIDVKFGFDRGNSIFKLNRLTNNYTVAIGQWSNGLFKKPTTYAELTSYNPYTEISKVRTYQVSMPRQKRLGVGLHIGYGPNMYNGKIIWSPNLSVGVNYNIIEW